MFLVNAAFLFVLSAFLMSLVDRVDRGRIFLVLAFGHCCVLFLIRASLLLNADFLYLPLFSYAYVTKILLLMMFWTLANDLVDSRSASSEFPFVAAGGTLGAIAVSFAIPTLLRIISPQNLLIAWAMISAIAGCLFLSIRKVYGAAFKPSVDGAGHTERAPGRIIGSARLLSREPLLKSMALLYFLLFFVLLNQQFTFYSELKARLSDAKRIASFLGYFNGISMFATVVLQFGVSGFVLKKIGSTRSMLFLPGVLCAVFAVLVVATAGLGIQGAGIEQSSILFWAVAAGMGMRVAFFDSFFSPNFQVFFSSLPQDIRGRGKLALEGVVKPAAMVMASIWIIVVAPRIPFALYMSVLFVASAALIVQAFRIRGKYAQSLTSYLSGFKSRNLPSLFNLVEIPNAENFLTMLGSILEKEEYEIKKFIIEILARMNTNDSVALLKDYCEKGDYYARATIISSLGPLKRDDCKELFVKFLDDADQRVVANCILALGFFGDAETLDRLEPYLRHPDARTRANAIVIQWNRIAQQGRRQLLSTALSGMLQAENDGVAASALFAMGEIGSTDFLPAIVDFVEKNQIRSLTSPSIRYQLVTALAKIKTEQSLDLIISLAPHAHARAKKDLCRAVSLLIEKGYSVSRCLSRIQTGQYLERGILLRALHEKRLVFTKQEFDQLEIVARAEVCSAYSDWISVGTLDTKVALKEVALLRTAVCESCIREKTGNIVLLAALLDNTGQIGAIMQRLRHANRHVRARAFEVLDNAGNIHVNRWLIGLLDSEDAVKHCHDATLVFKQRSKTLVETVAEYADGPDEWLRICAGYAQAALFESTRDARWGCECPVAAVKPVSTMS